MAAKTGDGQASTPSGKNSFSGFSFEPIEGPYRWISFCCALFVFFTIGRVVEVVPGLGGLPVVKLLAAAALLGVFFLYVSKKIPLRRSSIASNMLWVVGLAVLGIPLSAWKSGSVEFLSKFIVVVCLFWLVYKTAVNGAIFQRYVNALAYSALVLMFAAFFNPVTVENTGRLQTRTAYDTNDLALIMVVLLPLLLARYRLSAGLLRYFWMAMTFGALLVILKTQSRGGIIGLVCVLMALASISAWKRNISPPRISLAFKGGVLFVLLMIPLFFTLPEQARERISSIWSLSSDYNADVDNPDSRLAIWSRGLQALSTRPWGVGIGAYSAVEGAMGGRYYDAHNFIIKALVELGLVGFTLYALALTRTFRLFSASSKTGEEGGEARLDDPDHIRRIYSQHLLCSLVGFTAAGMFLSQSYAAVLFVLLGLASALEGMRGAGIPEVAGKLK